MRVFLFIASFLICATAQSQITTEEDEFTGAVTISSEYFSLEVEDGDLMSANAMYLYSESNFIFAVATLADGWQHLSDKEMNFLIDGERKAFSVVHKDSDTNTSGSNYSLTEINGIILSESDFQQFTNATEVRFKFGKNVYKVSNTGLQYAEMIYNEVNK